MRNLFATLSLLILLAINLSATLEPVRIAVVAATPSPSTEHDLVIDVLNADGTPNTVHITKTGIKTNNGGVISVVIDESEWTGSSYDPTYLVRVTYNGVVLSIDRMDEVFAKQGDFGAFIDPSEMSPLSQWFYMPSVSFNTATTGDDRTKDLYQEYKNQFSSPPVKSTGAPATVPYLPAATDLYYYITYYDTSVFDDITIDANGVMTYDVISSATDCSYINIVFVIK